jgi:hypothetical protein
MMEHRPAYDPALESIADEYDIDIAESHHRATIAGWADAQEEPHCFARP